MTAWPQEVKKEFEVHYTIGSDKLNPNFDDNGKVIDNIVEFIDCVNGDDSIRMSEVTFYGTASPEGGYELNRDLAANRRIALEKEVLGRVVIPDSIIHRDSEYIAWRRLARWVSESDMAQKQAVLDILAEPARLVPFAGDRTIDARVPKLIKLDGGEVWRQLMARYFAEMRAAGVIVDAYRLPPPPVPASEPETVVAETVVAEVEDSGEYAAPAPVVNPGCFTPRFTVKTNAVGWAMAIANLGVEIDLCKHLSINVPVYFSAANYFKQTIKFRTFAVEPGVRVWTSCRNDGFFVEPHFGLAYYNFAIGGDYRYQDHNGTTPALGGGLALGYRLPIGRDKRWKAEFSVGGGCYKLHYDKFRNTDRTSDGRLVGSVKKTWWGVDQVSVSFSYSFNLKKGGEK